MIPVEDQEGFSGFANREQVLSVEPTLRSIHGSSGLRKMLAPYVRESALRQLVILSFFMSIDIGTPANDLHGDDYGWFY